MVFFLSFFLSPPPILVWKGVGGGGGDCTHEHRVRHTYSTYLKYINYIIIYYHLHYDVANLSR